MEKVEQINIGDTQWELNEALEKYRPDTMAKVLDKLVEVIEKQGEIIDHLNSQGQEEICTHDFDLNNRCTKCGVRGVKDMIAKLQDTPEEKEEWRKRYVKRFGYWSEEIKFIQQLLEDREREAKIEVLTEIFQTCYQEDSRTLELVEERLQGLRDI